MAKVVVQYAFLLQEKFLEEKEPQKPHNLPRSFSARILESLTSSPISN